jgi:iron complex outermembrane recepter protein
LTSPSGDVAPVGLGAETLYTGLYGTDTFDVTSRLSVTGGARFNFAQIGLMDELGNDPELNGNHTYAHFNPMIGATYKLTPNLTFYGDYAVTNRAPTYRWPRSAARGVPPISIFCSHPH